MYMLDTNTCIFAIKGAKTKKYEHIISILNDKRANGLSVSVITLAELEFGVANSAIPEKPPSPVFHPCLSYFTRSKTRVL
jgi:tRNA(fMet)-specific endonuclease VapC